VNVNEKFLSAFNEACKQLGKDPKEIAELLLKKDLEKEEQ